MKTNYMYKLRKIMLNHHVSISLYVSIRKKNKEQDQTCPTTSPREQVDPAILEKFTVKEKPESSLSKRNNRFRNEELQKKIREVIQSVASKKLPIREKSSYKKLHNEKR